MTKNKIKAVACKQLAQKGYDPVNLSEIAKEVGIKTPSIYAFFKSKEDLIVAVYHDLLQEYYLYQKQSLEKITGATVKEKLIHILKGISQYNLMHPEKEISYTRLLYHLPPILNEEVKKIFDDIMKLYNEILTNIFSEGIEQGVLKDQPIEDLNTSFLCLMDGIYLGLFYYQEGEFNKRFEQTWNIYWNGICK